MRPDNQWSEELTINLNTFMMDDCPLLDKRNIGKCHFQLVDFKLIHYENV